MPDNLSDAYRLQDHSIAAWEDELVGWKVGGMSPASAAELGTPYLAGPIFAKSVQHAHQGRSTEMPVFEEGFAAIEPEFIIALGNTREEDRMFIGAEIASSPIPDINDYGPITVICDFGNNNGLLIGPEITDWRTRDREITVSTHINGDLIAESRLTDFPAAPLRALAFLLELAEQRGYDLPAGTFVSTGAITGVHEAKIGATSELSFSEYGTVELQLVPAVPA
ncbi:2-keto-4-pentenoate hydratase [Aurantiacibacter sp. MUD61]|uniref:2-keto-4-pentenoate hydratase n=1 Tax=Aurantiacibacter sp. MUD61 TaxID=3009083 RepID=UPI0022F127AA|nr:2-keto-4-pentenoate hydratase [Aurantiacibacter sp. MUD61]